MTKERILLMIEQLLKIYNDMEEDYEEDYEEDFDENNLIEFVWEDENWNWLYRFK